jgi:hypothetical protein
LKGEPFLFREFSKKRWSLLRYQNVTDPEHYMHNRICAF